MRDELTNGTPLKDVEVSWDVDPHDGNRLVRIQLIGEDWKDGFSTNESDDLYDAIIQDLYSLIVDHEEGKTIH